MKIFKKIFPSKSSKERKAIEVSISDTHFQVIAPSKPATLYAWSDIQEIRAVVEKDNEGDLFMHLKLRLNDAEVSIPRGCKGYKPFKKKISNFKDFTSSNYHQAIECTDIQQFILWRKKNASTQSKNHIKPSKSA